MKRPTAILIGLAMLASAGAVLARESAGGQGGGRQASAGFAGAHAGRHGGRPGVHHGQRHHRPIVVVRPGWRWHAHHGGAVVVTAPFFYPIYTPVPAPVYVEQTLQVHYYCPDYRDYYPNVATCPSQWMQVLPNPAPN